MHTRPLPDVARKKLNAHAKTISAHFPGATRIQFFDIGFVRMQIFEGNQMWQRAPWKILNFTISQAESFWVDAPEAIADTTELQPGREYSTYVNYYAFALETPLGQLEFASTLAELTQLHNQHYI